MSLIFTCHIKKKSNFYFWILKQKIYPNSKFYNKWVKFYGSEKFYGRVSLYITYSKKQLKHTQQLSSTPIQFIIFQSRTDFPKRESKYCNGIQNHQLLLL